jgi:Tol biopolymer transport system component
VTLSTGTNLGPYEILAPIGAGGMGEVYRARDTRLGRDVALKVLPEEFFEEKESIARFEREAKSLAAVSHPHIAALYSFEEISGRHLLVMELVEGQTISERLLKGPLPLDQLLTCATEIALALDAAHRHGIVHRDLKPGNVMLTRSGVKLLDFGLAKATTGPVMPSGLTSLPTEPPRNLTQQGTILGTIQYMAPEQLEGKEADARSDIFAFGALLYEMATGKKAFSASSQASLITAIMSADPPAISSVQPMMPPALDRVGRKCLAKDPEDRWQNAADLGSELKWIGESGSQAGVAAPVVARRRYRERLAWGVTAVVLLLAVAAVARYERRTTGFERSMRSSIVLPEKSGLRAVALSPDGTRLAFVARDSSGKNLLWIRPLDSLSVQPLPGTENPSFPFWSPDSRSVAFFADGKLKRIDTFGGSPQTLCDAPLGRGGTWSREGVILFSPGAADALYRVSASGGLVTPATRFDPARGETSHRWPFFLPDGRHFLYLVASFGFGREKEKMGIYVASLDSKEERFLLAAKSTLAYAQPGYLLFLREQNLVAQPFDAGKLRITGEPFPMAEKIQYFPQTFNALFSVSENGLLVYETESAPVLSRLRWLDRSGREMGWLGAEGDLANPSLSPDGKRVALDITDHQTGNIDIWIYQTSGGVATRVTSDPAIDATPIWSPDGERIIFVSLRQGHPDLYQRSSSGAGSEEAILRSERAKFATDWSPDGRFILYRVIDATTNFELWALPVGGDRTPIPFMKATFGASNGQFSPDGRWVAYSSNESGKWEIGVTPFPGPGGNWKVSGAGGSEPRWRRDGKELFYLAPDGKLMAVEVKAGSTFEAGAATPLFQIRRREPLSSTDLFSYDVSADGQRFLVNTDVGEPTSPPLTVALNWTAGLKR